MFISNIQVPPASQRQGISHELFKGAMDEYGGAHINTVYGELDQWNAQVFQTQMDAYGDSDEAAQTAAENPPAGKALVRLGFGRMEFYRDSMMLFGHRK